MRLDEWDHTVRVLPLLTRNPGEKYDDGWPSGDHHRSVQLMRA